MSTGRKVSLVLTLALVVLTVGVGGLFWSQNSSRLTGLSLDLYVTAVQLQTPLPVPTLLLLALAVGLVLGGGLGVFSSFNSNLKVRDLEARLARADLNRSDDDDWT